MGSLETARQLFLDGLERFQHGSYREAEAKLLQSLELAPERASTLTNLSAARYRLGKFDAALDSAQRAIDIDPSGAEAWLNKGNALCGLKKHAQALEPYDRAIALKPELVEAWSNKGAALCSLQRPEESLAHCDRAIALDPAYAEAWTNKGLALRECRRHDEALAHHRRALDLRPGYAEAWLNLGLTKADQQRKDEALADYDQAIALKPDLADAWANRGAVLLELLRFDDAVQAYERAHALDPDSGEALAMLVHAQLQAADWRELDGRVARLAERVSAGREVVVPFTLLSAADSPALQLKAAQDWVHRKCPGNDALGPIAKRSHGRIRVGYFSSDFSSHPVSYLTAELFEAHDRERFEILGLSLRGAREDDGMRKRLETAFDRFIDLERQPDLEAARIARDLELDIAVDLGGHTQGARTRIFALRAAPLQVNFLGYPATMGAAYIDYLIADRTVVPEALRDFYAEKIVELPGCFQCNDARRSVSDAPLSRASQGLPQEGFVFCCFNNNYKINPAIFGIWMRILKNAQGSCLWLLANAPSIEARYREAARRHGVDPRRLVFGGRLPAPEYRARFRVADLALDTVPFNAGTTASDALWAGLPVLTLAGQSFCARMAGSLLQAIGLPELVAQTPAAYESAAIGLARDPEALRGLRRKLEANRRTMPLFDTPRYARHLEQAYARMVERQRAGLPPAHLRVEA